MSRAVDGTGAGRGLWTGRAMRVTAVAFRLRLSDGLNYLCACCACDFACHFASGADPGGRDCHGPCGEAIGHGTRAHPEPPGLSMNRNRGRRPPDPASSGGRTM